MQLNKAAKKEPVFTHEGTRAASIGDEFKLRRSVMACLLWEDEFYESGETIAARIVELVPRCRPEFVAACAYHARTQMKLRHVPLLLVREMARHPRHKALVGRLLCDVIQRPDELTEFLAIYWKDGRQPLSAQVKKGLARAFNKFDEYAFAKYDRDGKVKLRDALFLSHANPCAPGASRYTKDERRLEAHDAEQRHRPLNDREVLFKKIVDRTLAVPDTWEVALSAGADKRATFERLMAENRLGALAFLRNLRNMEEAGVDKLRVSEYAARVDLSRVLPFRFIAAARAVPRWEDVIEPMMLKALAGRERLRGRTALLIDGSASMDCAVSAKSDITRRDAACALAILLRELCEDVRVICFSTNPWDIPPRRGFALRDAICERVIPQSTMLGRAVRNAQRDGPLDRIVVITDEQSQDTPPDPEGFGYVINVASAANGIGYGAWVHIDGWSEAVLDYIREDERVQREGA